MITIGIDLIKWCFLRQGWKVSFLNQVIVLNKVDYCVLTNSRIQNVNIKNISKDYILTNNTLNFIPCENQNEIYLTTLVKCYEKNFKKEKMSFFIGLNGLKIYNKNRAKLEKQPDIILNNLFKFNGFKEHNVFKKTAIVNCNNIIKKSMQKASEIETEDDLLIFLKEHHFNTKNTIQYNSKIPFLKKIDLINTKKIIQAELKKILMD